MLAKSAPSGGSPAAPRDEPYNAVTMAAIQKGLDAVNGKRKVKWSRFPPEATAEETKEIIKRELGH